MTLDTLGVPPEGPWDNLRREVWPTPGELTVMRFELDLDRGERAATLLATGRAFDARTGAHLSGAEISLRPRVGDGGFGDLPRRV